MCERGKESRRTLRVLATSLWVADGGMCKVWEVEQRRLGDRQVEFLLSHVVSDMFIRFHGRFSSAFLEKMVSYFIVKILYKLSM